MDSQNKDNFAEKRRYLADNILAEIIENRQPKSRGCKVNIPITGDDSCFDKSLDHDRVFLEQLKRTSAAEPAIKDPQEWPHLQYAKSKELRMDYIESVLREQTLGVPRRAPRLNIKFAVYQESKSVGELLNHIIKTQDTSCGVYIYLHTRIFAKPPPEEANRKNRYKAIIRIE